MHTWPIFPKIHNWKRSVATEEWKKYHSQNGEVQKRLNKHNL